MPTVTPRYNSCNCEASSHLHKRRCSSVLLYAEAGNTYTLINSNSEPSTPLRLPRTVLVFFYCVIVLSSGAGYYNWPPFSALLYKSGAYSWLCQDTVPTDQIKGKFLDDRTSIQFEKYTMIIDKVSKKKQTFLPYLFSYIDKNSDFPKINNKNKSQPNAILSNIYPQPIKIDNILTTNYSHTVTHPATITPFTTTLSLNQSITTPGCPDQEISLVQLYTWGFVISQLGGLVSGIYMDSFGPRITAITGLFLCGGGWFILSLASQTNQLYSLAMVLIGGSVSFTGLPGNWISSLFSCHSGFVLSVLSASFDASFSVPLILQYIWESPAPTLSFYQLLAYYVWGLILPLLIISFFIFPNQLFHSPKLISNNLIDSDRNDEIVHSSQMSNNSFLDPHNHTEVHHSSFINTLHQMAQLFFRPLYSLVLKYDFTTSQLTPKKNSNAEDFETEDVSQMTTLTLTNGSLTEDTFQTKTCHSNKKVQLFTNQSSCHSTQEMFLNILSQAWDMMKCLTTRRRMTYFTLRQSLTDSRLIYKNSLSTPLLHSNKHTCDVQPLDSNGFPITLISHNNRSFINDISVYSSPKKQIFTLKSKFLNRSSNSSDNISANELENVRCQLSTIPDINLLRIQNDQNHTLSINDNTKFSSNGNSFINNKSPLPISSLSSEIIADDVSHTVFQNNTVKTNHNTVVNDPSKTESDLVGVNPITLDNSSLLHCQLVMDPNLNVPLKTESHPFVEPKISLSKKKFSFNSERQLSQNMIQQHRRHWLLHATFCQQVTSLEFLNFLIFFTVCSVRSTFLNITCRDIMSPYFATLIGICSPFAFFPCLLFGRLVDVIGIVKVSFALNSIGVGMNLFVLIPLPFFHYVVVLFYVLHSSFIYGQLVVFVSKTFGLKNFGKFMGLSTLLDGLITILDAFLYYVSIKLLKGNFFGPNIGFLIISILCYVPIINLGNYIGYTIENDSSTNDLKHNTTMC